MKPDEKTRLLELFEHADRWCRHTEAVDASGDGVVYDDAAAVAWDLTGALCRLFGWKRARVLFEHMSSHIHGKRKAIGWPPRDTAIEAMKVLQDFNDCSDTTFNDVRTKIEAMPVSNRGKARDETPLES